MIKVVFVLILGIFNVATCDRLPENEEKRIFEEHLKKYSIRIGRNGDSREVMQENFLKNFYEIEEHNKAFRNGSSSYEQEVNEFAHLDPAKLLETHSGYIPGSFNATPAPIPDRSARAQLPSSFSWTNQGSIVGPVTDQGQCGSCTIFAVIGVMESHMRLRFGVYTKLSEQEAMQCCGGCNGGTNTNIYTYAKNGGTYESGFKYVARPLEQCNTRRPRVGGSKVLSYYRVRRGAVSDAMVQLVNKGPLATGLCLPGSINFYKRGVYDEENMSDCGWHAVMVVGYGNENGRDYWLVRNSWASTWGDKGYFKITRGKNRCRIEDDFTYPNMGW